MRARDARPRALGVVGSPRRLGNTGALVEMALRGAESVGAIVDRVCIADLDIGPCRGCDVCRSTGLCAQRDDMDVVVGKLNDSEVWVLGTPLYFWGPTAQFKALIDRFHGARRRVGFAGKRVVLVIPMESGDERAAGHAVGMVTKAFDGLGSGIFTTVIAPGVGHRGAVLDRPELLDLACAAGRRAVEDVAAPIGDPALVPESDVDAVKSCCSG